MERTRFEIYAYRQTDQSWNRGKYDNEIMAERRRLVDVTRSIVDDDVDYNNNNNDDKAEKIDDDKEEDDDFEFLSELQTTMARDKENAAAVVATSDEGRLRFRLLNVARRHPVRTTRMMMMMRRRRIMRRTK